MYKIRVAYSSRDLKVVIYFPSCATSYILTQADLPKQFKLTEFDFGDLKSLSRDKSLLYKRKICSGDTHGQHHYF